MVQSRETLKDKAKELRREGNSYSQISTTLKIPKSTLSTWFSKITWSNKVKQNLTTIQKGKKGNLQAANSERQRRTELRHLNIINSANKEFKILRKDRLFIIGLSLYWGEGEKTNSGRVSVVNTDPEMIRVMANFYRKCLHISEKHLRVGLFIYEDLDLQSVSSFWSKYLNIPQEQFIKTQILKSRTRLTHRKSKYGICSLYFSNTAQSIKIREWIRLMGQEIAQ